MRYHRNGKICHRKSIFFLFSFFNSEYWIYWAYCHHWCDDSTRPVQNVYHCIHVVFPSILFHYSNDNVHASCLVFYCLQITHTPNLITFYRKIIKDRFITDGTMMHSLAILIVFRSLFFLFVCLFLSQSLVCASVIANKHWHFFTASLNSPLADASFHIVICL